MVERVLLIINGFVVGFSHFGTTMEPQCQSESHQLRVAQTTLVIVRR